MFLLKILAFIVCSVVLIILAYVAWVFFQTRPRRRLEPGFEYVWVEDDGNARELTADEMEYLKTEFEPGDSGRPYIKFRYESLTPDGRMVGYLRRRQLPQDKLIRPAPSGRG